MSEIRATKQGMRSNRTDSENAPRNETAPLRVLVALLRGLLLLRAELLRRLLALLLPRDALHHEERAVGQRADHLAEDSGADGFSR